MQAGRMFAGTSPQWEGGVGHPMNLEALKCGQGTVGVEWVLGAQAPC